MATAFNLIKSMTKRGNVIIGSGCYAAALESLSSVDRVIKIGNNLDDPWLDYYEEIIKPNQDNPCVPKVFSLNIQRDHSYYVCVMERLVVNSTLTDSTYKAKAAIRDYVAGDIDRDTWLDIIVDFPRLVPHPAYMLRIMDEIKNRSDLEDECDYDSDYDDLWNVRRVDLHTDNILQRENGQLVITDPWCHADDLMTGIVDVSNWVDSHINPY